MNKVEMENKIKKLDKEIDNKIAEKVKLQEEHFKLYELETIKKKYINKCFVYKNNCYSCPSKESDYWDVYYKVINVNENGGIVAVSLQKDKYGKIESIIGTIGMDYLNLEEITEKEYIKETSKILGVLQERFNI